MARRLLLGSCAPVAILLLVCAALVVTRLACGLDLRSVHPIQGGASEVLWTVVHWLGLRNLAVVVAWVPGYQSVQWAAGAAPEGTGPRVALTIDDAVGENSTGVSELLDLLRDHDVLATFFTIANHVTFGEGRPQVLQEIAERGHEIGNHGVHDDCMAFLSADEVDEVLTQWETRVGPLIQGWPQLHTDRKWFRPPKGLMSAAMADVLQRRNYSVALGDIYSDDWLIPDAPFHQEVIKSLAVDGSVIILHVPDRPDRMQTLDILRDVIPSLQGRGVSFLRLSELYGEAGQPPSHQLNFTFCVIVAIFGCLHVAVAMLYNGQDNRCLRRSKSFCADEGRELLLCDRASADDSDRSSDICEFS